MKSKSNQTANSEDLSKKADEVVKPIKAKSKKAAAPIEQPAAEASAPVENPQPEAKVAKAKAPKKAAAKSTKKENPAEVLPFKEAAAAEVSKEVVKDATPKVEPVAQASAPSENTLPVAPKKEKAPAKKAAPKKIAEPKKAAESTTVEQVSEEGTTASEVTLPAEVSVSEKAVATSENQNFVDTSKPIWSNSVLTEQEIQSFQNGTNHAIYNSFGSKKVTVQGKEGFQFTVWAPHASHVSVIGNFNNWNGDDYQLFPRWDKSGIWEGFIPGVQKGDLYKYRIIGNDGSVNEKSDPLANYCELKPQTASIAYEFDYQWKDSEWMQSRKKANALDAPWSVYEVHLASWMRPDRNNEHAYNDYFQIAERLVPYIKEMGFTHVEFMPVMEHPFDGSWGYQLTGYFAATSRFGSPEGLMHLIDQLHQAGIGVILDWVPSHFPYDAHGLFMFDGANTYEYADMRKGFHPDWNSYIFNYKRGEIKSFLISGAHFWFQLFHIDGIRVDAVSSILKLDYSREEGQWEANVHGGNGNLEAIEFIKDLNLTIYRDFPDVQTIAEESTDWPGVSSPTNADGLGFGMKWMMGWMHDTLNYFKLDPLYRKHHQDKFSFSMVYYHDEKFMLPLSHDEVVHGKSPMLYKMPGDDWQKFANLRMLYTYMWTHPGAKLLFMGNEFGQTSEWNYKSELDWFLLQHASHNGLKECVKDLNSILKSQPALYDNQFDIHGFQWIDLNHRDECVIVYRRKGKNKHDDLLVILNLTPEPRWDWVVDLPEDATYAEEVFNSDAEKYWGSGHVFNPHVRSETSSEKVEKVNRIFVNLPPLGAIILK